MLAWASWSSSRHKHPAMVTSTHRERCAHPPRPSSDSPSRTVTAGVSVNTTDTAGMNVVKSANSVRVAEATRLGSRRAAPCHHGNPEPQPRPGRYR